MSLVMEGPGLDMSLGALAPRSATSGGYSRHIAQLHDVEVHDIDVSTRTERRSCIGEAAEPAGDEIEVGRVWIVVNKRPR